MARFGVGRRGRFFSKRSQANKFRAVMRSGKIHNGQFTMSAMAKKIASRSSKGKSPSKIIREFQRTGHLRDMRSMR